MSAPASPASPLQPAGTGLENKTGVSTRALALSIAAGSLLSYLPLLRNGFVDLDDPAYLTHNDHVLTGISWRNIQWALSSTEAANWHPLTWFSHMLDCQIFGLHAAGHHAVSAVLHAVNAVLLFMLLERATRLSGRSFFVAALFSVHPLNVETVAWASERKTLLCMFFSLLCVTFYAKFVRQRRWSTYLPVVLCLALALLAKPMAVTVPVILLLLDYWPLERMQLPVSARAWRAWLKEYQPLLVEKIPLFAMSGASSWITVVAQRSGHAVTSMDYLPMWQRWENAAYSYVKYILKIFWPA